jgi:TM2 domain-containing membrane protein YozV
MKNKRKSFWICLFFGWLGVHRFYERKIWTGILYMCTCGLFCIGWVFDLWILLITPNKPITESYQYNTYLKVVEALQKSGCDISEYIREWSLISANVWRGSVYCGHIFAVADPRPDFVSSMIVSIFSGYEKYRYDLTEYASWKRIFKSIRSKFERNGYDFGSYHYWPNNSLVAGIAEASGKPTDDNQWLSILKSVIG